MTVDLISVPANSSDDIIIIPRGSEILSCCPAGDSCVSWVGRTLKPWLATFLGEGKL